MLLPTPRLVGLLLFAAPVFALEPLWSPALGLASTYLLGLGFAVLVDALSLRSRTRVSLERSLPHRIGQHAAAMVGYRLTNETRSSLLVQIAERLPEYVEGDRTRHAVRLEGGQSRRLEDRIVAQRRGVFEFERVDVRVTPVWGLLARQTLVELPAQLRVLPNLTALTRCELELRRGLRDVGLSRIRHRGQGSEFESLRQYVPGDDFSQIEWKATARRGVLVTRNLEAERRQSVIVALDVGRSTAGEIHGKSRLDTFVDATLLLAYVTLRQGDWFSLVAFSGRIERYLPPLRGLQNIGRVADALCPLDTRLEEPDYGAACRFLGLRNRKRSLMVLMTDVIDEDANDVMMAYMARYARYHLPLVATLTDTELLEMAVSPLGPDADPYVKAVALDTIAARERALRAMRHRGVGVLDVEPQNMTPALLQRYLQLKVSRRL